MLQQHLSTRSGHWKALGHRRVPESTRGATVDKAKFAAFYRAKVSPAGGEASPQHTAASHRAGGGHRPVVYSNKEGQDSNNATRVSSLNDTSDFPPTTTSEKYTFMPNERIEISLNRNLVVINTKTEQHVR